MTINFIFTEHLGSIQPPIIHIFTTHVKYSRDSSDMITAILIPDNLSNGKKFIPIIALWSKLSNILRPKMSLYVTV